MIGVQAQTCQGRAGEGEDADSPTSIEIHKGFEPIKRLQSLSLG